MKVSSNTTIYKYDLVHKWVLRAFWKAMTYVDDPMQIELQNFFTVFRSTT